MSARPVHARRVLIELAVAALVIALPLPVPPLLVLVLLASISLALRGESWLDTSPGDPGPLLWTVAMGLVLGTLVAVVLDGVLGPGPVSVLLVKGNTRALWAGLIVALASSVASEMLYRGYVISRLEVALGAAGARAGIVLGALLATLASSPANLGAACSLFVLSLGYAFLYLAGRRSLVLPMAVHFALLAQPLIYEFADW